MIIYIIILLHFTFFLCYCSLESLDQFIYVHYFIILRCILVFIIHPCDPTVVICYLIWPCDIAVRITYLISHSSSLSYNTVIKLYFRLGVYNPPNITFGISGHYRQNGKINKNRKTTDQKNNRSTIFSVEESTHNRHMLC